MWMTEVRRPIGAEPGKETSPKSSELTKERTPAKVLEVTALSKDFGGTAVINSISFFVGVQELVVIIGPSGSGKSTLLRCLNLLERPTAGSVVVDGVDMLDPATNINAMRQKIGMVFQSFNLYPHMTALDNVGTRGAQGTEARQDDDEDLVIGRARKGRLTRKGERLSI